MIARSHSASELLRVILFGPQVRGEVLLPRSLRFQDYVVSLTAPGQPRMPNGVECAIALTEGSRVGAGGGRLVIGGVEIEAGPEWNPVPQVVHAHRQPAGPEPLLSALSPWVSAPEPAGDEMLAGYVAGLVLLHRRRLRAARISERSAGQMHPYGATLLRHAARGEVPERIHDLMVTGDPALLLEWSASGMWWLRGLVSAGLLLKNTDVPVPPHAGRSGFDAEAIMQ